MVKTRSGTLLAFAEGRVNSCGDAGDVDIVVKRSTDGGRTWSRLSVVNQGGGNTHGNPTPIVDRETGRILLAETYNTATPDGTSCATPCDRTPHMQFSDDDGVHWSPPRDLSSEILPADWNSWYATGPAHGVQLTRGPHAGRLVFGVNAETWDGTRVAANHASLIVSDDGGDHWRIGAQDSWPIAGDQTFRQKPSELTLAERDDGGIYVSGREEGGTDLGHRNAAFSTDGGDSFTAPFRDLPDLYTPEVEGSILNLGDGHLLMSCPADPDRRRTMMIRSSWDGGTTWDAVDRGNTITTDWSGYSDMVQADGGTVGLVYEGGAVDARDEIRFARVSEDALAARQGAYPDTADSVAPASGGFVLGGPQTTAGMRGKAFTFDGADDAVRLPFRGTLPLGTRNFTVSLWFRYSATTGQYPILWMGGVGAIQPQVWVRGEPGSKRIRALITTRDGASAPTSASVNTAAAHNDGQWHQLVLRRTTGKLTLTVGTTSVNASDVPGSVSRNSPFGVHVGQRMDSLQYFRGSLDDVRVYNRALSDSEVTGLRNGTASPTNGLVFRLPLDSVHNPG